MKITCENFNSKEASEMDIRMVFASDYVRGSFVILEEAPNIMIQTAGEGNDGYILEYQDGDCLYRCKNLISKQKAEAVFLNYLKRDVSWKQDFLWIHVKP